MKKGDAVDAVIMGKYPLPRLVEAVTQSLRRPPAVYRAGWFRDRHKQSRVQRAQPQVWSCERRAQALNCLLERCRLARPWSPCAVNSIVRARLLSPRRRTLRECCA